MTGPRILVIEDDPDVVLLLEDMLADAVYTTAVWSRCAGAVVHIYQTRPDLVLFDLWLEQRGARWAIVQARRQNPMTAHLPVIICTADRRAVDAEAAAHADACSVLLKPFDVNTPSP